MEVSMTTRKMNILLNSPITSLVCRQSGAYPEEYSDGQYIKAKKYEVVGGDKHKIEFSAV